jgi:hypothetical protein
MRFRTATPGRPASCKANTVMPPGKVRSGLPLVAPRVAAGLCVVAVLLLEPRRAAAESDADADVARRLAFIEARLERASSAATIWWSAWFYGYVTVTIGQAAVALAAKDPGLRTDTAVGASFATLGVVGIGAFDFPARHAAVTLAASPARTPAERRRKLARAEQLLASSARSEVVGRSWVGHVAGGAVTLTSSLVLALVYKRVASSIITAISGAAITEAQVFTRPTAAIDDWRAYQQGAFASAPAPRAGAPWRLVPHPGGVGFAASF